MLHSIITEGGETKRILVPLITVWEYAEAHDGRLLNDAIANGDMVDWEPWVAWHAATERAGETRPFDEWLRAVDWVSTVEVSDGTDPSGGETASTAPPSPESSSTPARGRSSSRTTTSSSSRSGTK